MTTDTDLAFIAELLDRLCALLLPKVSHGDRKAKILFDAIKRRSDEAKRLIEDASPEDVMLFLLDPVPNPVDLDAVSINLDIYPGAQDLMNSILDRAARLSLRYTE